MTNKELLSMYVKLCKRIDVLEDALAILQDEPYATGEPDNAEFCAALELRIERSKAVAENYENLICRKKLRVL